MAIKTKILPYDVKPILGRHFVPEAQITTYISKDFGTLISHDNVTIFFDFQLPCTFPQFTAYFKINNFLLHQKLFAYMLVSLEQVYQKSLNWASKGLQVARPLQFSSIHFYRVVFCLRTPDYWFSKSESVKRDAFNNYILLNHIRIPNIVLH